MLRFTRHARNRMRLYGIEAAVVEECLAQPGWVMAETLGGRTLHSVFRLYSDVPWRSARGPYLQVVYAAAGEDRIIVSVGPRETLPRALR